MGRYGIGSHIARGDTSKKEAKNVSSCNESENIQRANTENYTGTLPLFQRPRNTGFRVAPNANWLLSWM
jgi:hypothetical protein